MRDPLIFQSKTIEELDNYAIKESIYKTGDRGYTLLDNFCICGKVNLIKHLLDRYNYDVNRTNKNGQTSLEVICCYYSDSVSRCELKGDGTDFELEIIKLLLENGANVNVGKGVLNCVCFWNVPEEYDAMHLELVNIILKYKPNDYLNALKWAFLNGKDDILKTINDYCKMDRGYSCRFDDHHDDSCYDYTLYRRGYERIDSLIPKRHLTLISACSYYKYDIYQIKDLVNRQCDINLTDSEGNNALILAVMNGHLEVIEFLLDYTEIDVDFQNNFGDTALIFAIEQQEFEIAKMLLLYTRNINLENQYGNNALRIALKLEKSFKVNKFIKLLIKHGAEI